MSEHKQPWYADKDRVTSLMATISLVMLVALVAIISFAVAFKFVTWLI